MPSILDGLPRTQAELQEAHLASAIQFGEIVAQADLTARSRSIIDAMGEGRSLGDVLGITREERDALLVHGFRQLQQGDAAGAQVTLTQLYHIEPMDERVIYALAATYQAQEQYAAAAKLYLCFLAYDATNPQGYLRIAECFLAAREYPEAEAYIEAARVQAAGSACEADVDRHAGALSAAIPARPAA